jgi:hypothetical protein
MMRKSEINFNIVSPGHDSELSFLSVERGLGVMPLDHSIEKLIFRVRAEQTGLENLSLIGQMVQELLAFPQSFQSACICGTLPTSVQSSGSGRLRTFLYRTVIFLEPKLLPACLPGAV